MIYYYSDPDGNERSIDYGNTIPGFLIESFEKSHIIMQNLNEFARVHSRDFIEVVP